VKTEPAEVFPVGVFVRDEIQARGWTVDDLLNRMPGDRGLNSLWLDLVFAHPDFDLEMQRDIRLGDAQPLAHAFDTSLEFWENLDSAYHSAVLKRLEARGAKH
jgi:HTH-type transcriptional regulator / antitoxin HigA